MNLRIIESSGTYLVIDTGALLAEGSEVTVIDAYHSRAEAESFLQFIGQSDIGEMLGARELSRLAAIGSLDELEIPTPAISDNLVGYVPTCHDRNGNGEEPDQEWI